RKRRPLWPRDTEAARRRAQGLAPGRNMDRERIEACYRELLGAWNRRDASGFAALFTEDGLAVRFDGSAINTRAEIASTLSAVFHNELTGIYAASISGIRETAPGVVLRRAIVGTIPPDTFDLNLRVKATQSVFFLERPDDVKVPLLQGPPAAFHGRSEVAE